VGETTHQIENHLGKTRDELGENLHELEHKLQDMADWRYHYRNHPLALVGVAFGGGVLLAALFGGRRRRTSHAPSGVPTRSKQNQLNTWRHVKEAVVGVAMEKAMNFAEEFLPGVGAQYRKVTTRSSS
jgi:hypothetical protein